MAKPSSSVVIMPPSPNPPRFLDGKKLNAPKSPIVPTGWPPNVAPIDCAASSSTARSCSLASRCTPSMSAAWPNKCTGMIALVLSVTRPAAAARSMLKSVSIESTNTGVAPVRAIAPAVAKNVNDGHSTSSPGPMPSVISESSSASVPELTPMACLAPTDSAATDSNPATSGPRMNCDESSTRAKAAFSSAASGWFCALRSSSGTLIGSPIGAVYSPAARPGASALPLTPPRRGSTLRLSDP